ncbi:unnamed protein product [Cochlearia groenlandica]
MEKTTPRPVCGEEAIALLNCVTDSPYDQDKCVRFLQSLRECVLSKKVKKFAIPSQDNANEGTTKKPT